MQASSGATGSIDPSTHIKGWEDPFITVQIPESEIFDSPPSYTETDTSINRGEKKGSWLKRHLSPNKPSETIGVRMRRSEFTKYFVKDQKTGQYRDGVVEPPGGRRQWLQQRVRDFRSGMLDEDSYYKGMDDDYTGLDGRKKSAVGQAVNAGLDFFGQPYTPWGGKPIR